MIELIKRHAHHMKMLALHAMDSMDNAKARSPRWPRVRDAFLKDHTRCAACNGTHNLNVHHIEPFHLDEEKELDPTNLITLCMGIDAHCHLLIGHGDDFLAFNPYVVADAAAALSAREMNDKKSVEMIIDSAKEARRFTLAA